ncbi:MAG TPA: hypothetical protein VFU99_02735 [Gaiellaceae bacterium]|nr:hypothetical protein [Gaiellaceae bacterium]
MSDQTIRGHETIAWIGLSGEGSEAQPATLEEAIHDVALQAAKTHRGKPIRVVEIEFIADNPHITQYRVKGVPG